MRDVIYIGSISVDGYIEAANGDSGWIVPDPELHRHFNELVMPTIVGSGTPVFHVLRKHIDLTPVEVRQCTAGAVLLRYRRAEATAAG